MEPVAPEAAKKACRRKTPSIPPGPESGATYLGTTVAIITTSTELMEMIPLGNGRREAVTFDTVQTIALTDTAVATLATDRLLCAGVSSSLLEDIVFSTSFDERVRRELTKNRNMK
mmetsp:Transcript_1465/g.4431  ORF Transcript_1465/g.4431 Transcript_1465/m.4431 type:complete len:116 (-) Transcript_1465:716-1063(-)